MYFILGSLVNPPSSISERGRFVARVGTCHVLFLTNVRYRDSHLLLSKVSSSIFVLTAIRAGMCEKSFGLPLGFTDAVARSSIVFASSEEQLFVIFPRCSKLL